MQGHKPRRLFVVLGMHRSGTSAIARGLVAMGVDLGSNLMPPAPINPKGFWEDLDIYALNEEILHTLGMTWHHFSPISAEDISTLCDRGYLLKASELLRSKFTDSDSLFGFKDPRTAKLLPFWRRVFSEGLYDVSYIIAYRNPQSIVESLTKRDNFELIKSYFLWLLHTLPSISETINTKRIVVDYDALIIAPDITIKMIAAQLALITTDDAVKSYVADFIDVELRHNTHHTAIDLLKVKECPYLIFEISNWFESVIQGNIELNNPECTRTIEEWARQLRNVTSIFYLLDKKYQELLEAQQQLACKDKILAERTVSFDTTSQHNILLQQELNDVLGQAKIDQIDLIDKERKINVLEAKVAELMDQSQKLEEVLMMSRQKIENQCEVLSSLSRAYLIRVLMDLNRSRQFGLDMVGNILIKIKNIFSKNRSYLDNNPKSSPSTLPSEFDAAAYLTLNPDVLAADLDAATHYIEVGCYENRRYKF